MANTYNTLGDLFTAIANAIRSKKQTSESIVAYDFPEEIEKIETGGGGNSPEAELALTLWAERAKSDDLTSMFTDCTSLTTVPLFDTGNAVVASSMFANCTSLTTVPLFDTSNVTTMGNMFSACSSLATVPLFITSNVRYMSYMFYKCTSLTTVPLFDTSKVTNMTGMFTKCTSLTTVPLFDTSKVTDMSAMFSNCTALTTVPLFDARNATDISSMFNGCRSLTECWLRNIKANLHVGVGNLYGDLLTINSLIHLIYECRNTGSMRTLTVGFVNLEKLENIYVHTIAITDEMRVEDDLIDEKLPFEVCESTDEGAVLISDYIREKNWQLK